MWNSMSGQINRVDKELLGETKGRYISSTEHNREIWWWSDDVQKVINVKRESFKTCQNNKNEENLKAYKLANKEAKRIIRDSKLKTFDNFYKKLDTKEGEKDIYKLAKNRERRSRDLGNVRCIKNDDNKLLFKNDEIKTRWKEYFNKLYNEDIRNDIILESNPNNKENLMTYIRNIKICEVKEALNKMKVGKGIRPDGIPIEA